MPKRKMVSFRCELGLAKKVEKAIGPNGDSQRWHEDATRKYLNRFPREQLILKLTSYFVKLDFEDEELQSIVNDILEITGND